MMIKGKDDSGPIKFYYVYYFSDIRMVRNS